MTMFSWRYSDNKDSAQLTVFTDEKGNGNDRGDPLRGLTVAPGEKV